MIDHFEKVSDKDGAVYARRLAKEEGILLGYSCGSAMAGLVQLKNKLKADDVVVIIFHDHGSRYVGKIYNDEWMRERGFLDDELKVEDLLNRKDNKEFITVDKEQPVKVVLDLMKQHDISQLPVTNGEEELVGSVTESTILSFILENPLNNIQAPIHKIMDKPFPVLDTSVAVKELNKYITKERPAVIAKDKSGALQVVTNYDIIQAL